MIWFLFKGLIRDRSRSFFPILVVTLGVMLTVIMHAWFSGVLNDVIDSNANFATGHVKIMSQAYAENEAQAPNDLALIGVERLLLDLKHKYPDIDWTTRIQFGGLLDIPDEKGETRSQSPVVGFAINLLDSASMESQRLNITNSLIRGSMPKKPGEILISEEIAQRLEVNPGEPATLISSTMYNAMAMQNFIISGTIRFGIKAVDRGAMIADLRDIQSVLDMQDAAGEILGFMKPIYHYEKALEMTNTFNQEFTNTNDEFSPIMLTLHDQNGLGEYLDLAKSMSGLMMAIFIIAMSIVLWNAGLIGGLRRYGEIGVRLAIGEFKGHLYRSLIAESILIAIMGTMLGTLLGLTISYIVQVKGVNFGALMNNSSVLISNIIRTRIMPKTYFIGLIPGLLSTVLGSMLSGIGIYKRQTAQLFKELEV